MISYFNCDCCHFVSMKLLWSRSCSLTTRLQRNLLRTRPMSTASKLERSPPGSWSRAGRITKLTCGLLANLMLYWYARPFPYLHCLSYPFVTMSSWPVNDVARFEFRIFLLVFLKMHTWTPCVSVYFSSRALDTE